MDAESDVTTSAIGDSTEIVEDTVEVEAAEASEEPIEVSPPAVEGSEVGGDIDPVDDVSATVDEVADTSVSASVGSNDVEVVVVDEVGSGGLADDESARQSGSAETSVGGGPAAAPQISGESNQRHRGGRVAAAAATILHRSEPRQRQRPPHTGITEKELNDLFSIGQSVAGTEVLTSRSSSNEERRDEGALLALTGVTLMGCIALGLAMVASGSGTLRLRVAYV